MRPPVALWVGILLALPSLSSTADVVFKHFEFEPPRSYGYFIGDVIRQQVRLELSHPFRLDPSQMPEEGRHDLWLVREAPRVTEHRERDRMRYEIELRYRIVNNPAQTVVAFTPSVALVVVGSNQRLTKTTPPWEYSLSPLASLNKVQGAGHGDIRPDRPPPPLDPSRSRFALWATVAVALGFSICLFHARFGLPGSGRRHLPFARACRDLRALARQPFNDEIYSRALQRFHQALNEVAGEAVFAGELERFFAEKPWFATLRPHIEALFARSEEVFFRSGAAIEPQRLGLQEIVRLAHECRRVER